jgi:hypothetical protein
MHASKQVLRVALPCALLLAVTSVHAQSAAPPAAQDHMLASLAAGAALNGGNTEAYSANGGGRFSALLYPHQFNVEALGTLGYARNPLTTEVEKTSANILGRARYDMFLSRMDAVFVALAPRRDTFAGLNIRLQTQLGYLRNLYFPDDAHRFWAELGYDLTYDDFAAITTTNVETNPPELPAAQPHQTILRSTSYTHDPGHDVVHSGRLFFGYTNTMHALATLNLGAETLFDVEDAKNVRINGTAEVNSSLGARFKLGVQFRILFDNVPVEGVRKKTDTITALQLIYTYDSLAAQPAAPECPLCDCTADVMVARAACASPEVPGDAATEPAAVPPEATPLPPPAPTVP